MVTDNEKVLNKILQYLSSMGNIKVRNHYDALGLVKDNALFGLLKDRLLYLRSENIGGVYYCYKGKNLPFLLVEDLEQIITSDDSVSNKNTDKILQMATKSFWIASRKIKN